MRDDSVLRQHLNDHTPGYVFLADADKNTFMEIPYSNMKEINISEDRRDETIMDDPLYFHMPVSRYVDWTIRFGKSLDGSNKTIYTVFNKPVKPEPEVDTDELEALLP